MDSARIASKLREQILRFSGELSRGLPKVVGRFVGEMIYGVQARQSVRLTEVSRALAETIPIKKTVERLSRQLRNVGLGAWLTGRLLQMAAERVRETTLLILDLSDVHKKYAKKMEHLATVWDVHPNQIRQWRVRLLEALPELFSGRRPQQEKAHDELEAELYRRIGQLQMELEWLKKKSQTLLSR